MTAQPVAPNVPAIDPANPIPLVGQPLLITVDGKARDPQTGQAIVLICLRQSGLTHTVPVTPGMALQLAQQLTAEAQNTPTIILPGAGTVL